MKSYKTIDYVEAFKIMEIRYSDKAVPFAEPEDIPNNWLKRNGYSMHRRRKNKKK